MHPCMRRLMCIHVNIYMLIHAFQPVSIHYRATFLQILPVQPCKEALGSCNKVHNRGEEVIGQLASGSAIIMAAAPPASDEILQVLGRCTELMRKRLQILSLQTIILKERGKSIHFFLAIFLFILTVLQSKNFPSL